MTKNWQRQIWMLPPLSPLSFSLVDCSVAMRDLAYHVLWWLLLLLFWLDVATAAPDDLGLEKFRFAAISSVALLFGSIFNDQDSDSDEDKQQVRRGPRDKPRDHVRCTMGSIFHERGPYYVRRAYRICQKKLFGICMSC
jgi:hypothetical protein